MYQKILLAYDGSREGRMALREGAMLAKRLGAELFLLAVTPTIVSPDAFGTPVVQTDTYEAILREGAANAQKLGMKVSAHLMQGDPVEVISAFAAKIKADLVVVGHRKRNLLERWWSGSSQSYLTDKLECSLLVSRTTISDDAFKTDAQSQTPSEA